MARYRTIKPEFWTSEQICMCSRDARLLFIGCWNFAEDKGIFKESPYALKSQIFPNDDDIGINEINNIIDELLNNKLLVRFIRNNKRMLYITGWKAHQKVDHPSRNCGEPPTEDELNQALNISIASESRKSRESLGESLAMDRIGQDRIGEDSKEILSFPFPYGNRKENISCQVRKLDPVDNFLATPFDGQPEQPRTAEQPKLNTRNEKEKKYLEDAKFMIEFLNKKTGKHFRLTKTNLDFVIARLRDGIEREDLQSIVAMKLREWKEKPEMLIYLRPATLFNKTKCEQYLGELFHDTAQIQTAGS